MAMRIRKVKGKVMALCAAQYKYKKGDLYLNDTIEHAIREKLYADFMEEGLIPDLSDVAPYNHS